MTTKSEAVESLRLRARNKHLPRWQRAEAEIAHALYCHVQGLLDVGLEPGTYGNLVGLWGSTPDEFLVVRSSMHGRTRVLRNRLHIWDDTWRAIMTAHNGACLYCGVTAKMELDHIVPLSKGGTNSATNLAPACVPCNRDKFTRLLGDWLPSRPDLSAAQITRRWEEARRMGLLDVEMSER